MSEHDRQNVVYSEYLTPDNVELIVTKLGWFNYEIVIQSFRNVIIVAPSKKAGKYCVVLETHLGTKRPFALSGPRNFPNTKISERR